MVSSPPHARRVWPRPHLCDRRRRAPGVSRRLLAVARFNRDPCAVWRSRDTDRNGANAGSVGQRIPPRESAQRPSHAVAPLARVRTTDACSEGNWGTSSCHASSVVCVVAIGPSRMASMLGPRRCSDRTFPRPRTCLHVRACALHASLHHDNADWAARTTSLTQTPRRDCLVSVASPVWCMVAPQHAAFCGCARGRRPACSTGR